jgi:hypothetical protein
MKKLIFKSVLELLGVLSTYVFYILNDYGMGAAQDAYEALEYILNYYSPHLFYLTVSYLVLVLRFRFYNFFIEHKK